MWPHDGLSTYQGVSCHPHDKNRDQLMNTSKHIKVDGWMYLEFSDTCNEHLIQIKARLNP